MKMVTKTFTKLAHEYVPDIARAVNKKIIPNWRFEVGYPKCSVYTGAGDVLVQCDIPLLLWDAYVHEYATTFSITLPSHYWNPT